MGSLLRALAPYAMAGSGTPKPPFPICAPSEPVSCAFRGLLRSIIDKPVGRPVEHNAESLVVCCSLVHSLPKASIRSPTRRRPCFGESLPAHSLNSLTSSPTRLISDRFTRVSSRRVDIPFYAAPRKLPNPPWEFLNARSLFITPSGILQTELVVGLDGFYRSYIASEVDTCTREEDDAAFPAVLFSSVRFEYRAAVASLRPPRMAS